MSSIHGRTVKYYFASTQQYHPLAHANKNGDFRRRFIVQIYLNPDLCLLSQILEAKLAAVCTRCHEEQHGDRQHGVGA
jgi:hypothetical protein